MSDPQQPTFLVSAYSEPVAVQIHGKANYLNCNNFREFMEKMVADGKRCFLLDFECCKGMDSTFLGILAGTALAAEKQTPAGKLTLCKLGERNRPDLQSRPTIARNQRIVTTRAPRPEISSTAWKTRKSPTRPVYCKHTKIWFKPTTKTPQNFKT